MSAVTALPKQLHYDLLGLWSTAWVTGGHSSQRTALSAQIISSLYIDSGLEIFLDIQQIRRCE